jgi:hypothetical protein
MVCGHQLPDGATGALTSVRDGRSLGSLRLLLPSTGKWADQAIHKLVLAIRSATGIESLVWLTDIGGLSREEAISSMRWTAAALLSHALTHGLPADA